MRHLFFDAAYRSEYVSALKFGNLYYQRPTTTAANRYPGLFSQCQYYLTPFAVPKILSFGCSTGEEVYSLGQYLPDAQIVGVDINEWCIKQCKKKYSEARFSFMHRLSAAFAATDGFDAIFCMAVFQRTENRTIGGETAQGLSFAQFENDLKMLDSKLNEGGLFVIDHADFSFDDTCIAGNYRPLNFEHNKALRQRPLFNSHNIKIADSHSNYRMYVKTGQAAKP